MTRPLNRDELKNIIEGSSRAERVPLLYGIWLNDRPFGGNADALEQWQATHVCDIQEVYLNFPELYAAPADAPDYRWAPRGAVEDATGGMDSRVVLKSWDEAEALYETFPSAAYPGLIPKDIHNDGRYLLARWWYTLFERHWSLRGMENALTDFFDEPEQVHRLYEKLTGFYLSAIERAHDELHADGFFVSDDLGGQAGPLFSPAIFREFFKPYYKRIIDRAHELGMHFWLHTCGDVSLFLDDFVEIGLDVIHPIQKHTMNGRWVAEKYGDKLCILAGFDVQQVIPYGTPDEVRREVREMIDTYRRPDGRFMLTFGNGATPDWRLDALEALFDESLLYGRG